VMLSPVFLDGQCLRAVSGRFCTMRREGAWRSADTLQK
jgi:hypothetical protein